MTVHEGNKLIGEFIGIDTGLGKPLKDYNHYHKSWNELMPVVEKISHYFNQLSDDDFKQVPEKARFIWEIKICAPSIQFVWQAVVDFIQWLNSEQEAKVSDTTKAD